MTTRYYYADASGNDDGTSEANAYEDFTTALEERDDGEIL